jgi:hypothetical protein
VSPSDEQIRGAIAEQAGEWFMENRSGLLDHMESARFMAWLQASPMHVEEYLRIAALVPDLETAAKANQTPRETLLARARGEPEGIVSFDRAGLRQPPVTARRRRTPAWSLAAAAALAVVAVTTVWSMRNGERRASRPLPVGATGCCLAGTLTRLRRAHAHQRGHIGKRVAADVIEKISDPGPIDQSIADAQTLPCIRSADAQRFGTQDGANSVEPIKAVGRDSEHQLELTMAACHEREGRQPSGGAYRLDLWVQQIGQCRFHANADAIEASQLIECRDEAVAGIHRRARNAPQGAANGDPQRRRVIFLSEPLDAEQSGRSKSGTESHAPGNEHGISRTQSDPP